MSIYIRDPQNGIYWMRFKVQGRSLHESTGFADRARAQEAHDRRRLQLLDEARLGRKPDRAWEDAAGEWLVQHAHKRTLAKDQEIVRWLHPWLSGKRLSEIDRDLLEKISSGQDQGQQSQHGQPLHGAGAGDSAVCLARLGVDRQHPSHRDEPGR